MLCEKPYMIGMLPCPCGRCLPCTINRRRVWAHRIMLEAKKHADNAFVTLTYSDENLPTGGSLCNTCPQKWLKRLRQAIAPRKIRFYLVGEYGDQTWRPHYHAIIFGLKPTEDTIVRSTWGKGHVTVGTVTLESAQYVAGYVTKKMTNPNDARLAGRYPEFSRMSLRPNGIGAPAMDNVSRALQTDVGMDLVDSAGDVPHSLNHGTKSLPLGRYLRRKLREAIGRNADVPEQAKQKYFSEMRQLQKDFREVTQNPAPAGTQKIVLDMNSQKRLNSAARTKIFTKGKKI